jgi:hypothetical protein
MDLNSDSIASVKELTFFLVKGQILSQEEILHSGITVSKLKKKI